MKCPKIKIKDRENLKKKLKIEISSDDPAKSAARAQTQADRR